jgi:hypothetical protein
MELAAGAVAVQTWKKCICVSVACWKAMIMNGKGSDVERQRTQTSVVGEAKS